MGLLTFGNKSVNRLPARRQRIESIEMQSKRFGYFPRRFRWRGRHYDVHAVERCWTTSTRRWGGRAQRHYFRVRCLEGDFELFQDIAHNTWHVARFEKVP